MTTPFNLSAKLKAKADLPDAVGPATMIAFFIFLRQTLTYLPTDPT